MMKKILFLCILFSMIIGNANATPSWLLQAMASSAGTGADYLAKYDFTQGTLPVGVTLTRASVGTYTDSSGVLQTASDDVARFDYNPTSHASLGLLYESSSTNLVAHSTPNPTNWTNYGGVLTANTVSSPDGTTNASTFADNSNNTRHIIYSSTTSISSGTSYVQSCYAKQSTFKIMQMGEETTAFSTSDFANYDLNTGTVVRSPYGGGSASVSNQGNGWYRVVLQSTALASGTYVSNEPTLVQNASNAARRRIYIGVGNQIYIWGCQTEVGTVPSSYIPNAGGSGVRSADVLTIPVVDGATTAKIIFDDSSVQLESISGTTYVVPTPLNRSHIKYIMEY